MISSVLPPLREGGRTGPIRATLGPLRSIELRRHQGGYLETLPKNKALLQPVRDAGLPTEERFADGAITVRVELLAGGRLTP
jgi:hypothetical protein